MKMATYKEILEAGEKLRNSDIKTISTAGLYKYMRNITGSHIDKTIKHYLILLKNANYIKHNGGETWDIIR